GYGLGQGLHQFSGGVLDVIGGWLLRAFRGVARAGLVTEAWRATENNRRAKYYSLTARGRRTLERETREWEAQSAAIARVLRASRGEL
ncbi:MAG: helix-turn-helix transcriptional regulator, partial [Acidobacteriota bacterium]|nr:helix-turn-helix transcriptional regulator [Acidobacteriota bacterium]